ncbi:MAG: S-layer homology domain-containing protein [Desulfotomaculaceae bacterium]|nr:S-layer homology domain-containing protein [Desulfotomaculaceae bacterium]
MRKQQLYRIAGLLLPVIMLFAMTGAVFAAEVANGQPAAGAFSDVRDDFWGKPAIENWSSKGVIKGDGTNFYPHGQISRAEMMTILGRIFGYGETTDNPFSDVKKGDWYYDALIKAYARGVMEGSFDGIGNRIARPNDPLTRAEAAVLFARIFSVTGESHSNFKDNLPEWAKEAIFGMEAAGFVHGKGNGLFDPSGSLTRAEAVQMLDNIVKLYVDQPSSYSSDVNGNVVVNTPGAVLKAMKITGNLYLAEGIGEGEISLENVTVTGSTFIRGASKITMRNSDLGTRVIEKESVALDEPQPETTVPGNTGAPGSAGGSGGSGGTGGSGDTGGTGDTGDPGEGAPSGGTGDSDGADIVDL